MDELDDILRRLKHLEDNVVRHRRGTVLDAAGRSVALGGSDVTYDGVSVLDGANLADDDTVSALAFGSDLLVLGRTGAGSSGTLFDEVIANYTPGSGQVYANTTSGPSITIPSTGLWTLGFGADIFNGGNSIAEIVWISVKLGAAAPSDNDTVLFSHAASGATQEASVARFMQRSLVAGDVIRHSAKSVNGASSIRKRWLMATPA